MHREIHFGRWVNDLGEWATVVESVEILVIPTLVVNHEEPPEVAALNDVGVLSKEEQMI